MEWSQLHPQEQANGFRRRMIAVRELGKYLNAVEINAYVYPSEFLSPTQRFKPYIFTDCELKAFFNATDIYPWNRTSEDTSHAEEIERELIEQDLLSKRTISRKFIKEYPDANIQRSTVKMKGSDRKKPCPCGSGKKFKKCCGQ